MKKREIVQPDKVQHFIAMLAAAFFVSIALGPVSAVAVSAAASVGKEMFDKFVRKEGFETGDLVADAAGIAAGIAIFFLASWLGYF